MVISDLQYFPWKNTKLSSEWNLSFTHFKIENATEQMYTLCILLYYLQTTTALEVILLTLPWKYMNRFLHPFCTSSWYQIAPGFIFLLWSIRKSDAAIDCQLHYSPFCSLFFPKKPEGKYKRHNFPMAQVGRDLIYQIGHMNESDFWTFF